MSKPARRGRGPGKIKGARALGIVRHFFPKVTSVVDADKPIFVEVTQKDCDSAKVKDHTVCAMAVAAKRTYHADGVIVSVSKAYIIKGAEAVRYDLPPSTSREVVSFDRKGGFAVGEYELSAVPPRNRLGSSHYDQPVIHPHTEKTKLVHRFQHRTTGIRTVLGGRRIS